MAHALNWSPEAVRDANRQVHEALRLGFLEYGDECMSCGASGEDFTLHHPDYAEPLLVQTLCKRCHARIHAGLVVEPDTGRRYLNEADETPTIGQLFRIARQRSGMRQVAFSRALGVSQAAVSRWEGDKAVPSAFHLVAAAEVLSIDPGDLVAAVRRSSSRGDGAA